MFETSRQGAVTVIAGDVPLTAENASEFRAAVEACAREGTTRIVVDLNDIPLIDSQGLELLLELQDQVVARAGLVKLCGANSLCQDILEVTGVGHRFEIHTQAKGAVGSFAL